MSKAVELKSLHNIHKFLKDLPQDELSFVLERHKLGGLYKESHPEFFKKYWVINKSYQDFIQNELLQKNLRGTFLKGTHLIARYYPEIGMRFLGDIDILTPEKIDFDSWCESLTHMGFKEYEEKSFKDSSPVR